MQRLQKMGLLIILLLVGVLSFGGVRSDVKPSFRIAVATPMGAERLKSFHEMVTKFSQKSGINVSFETTKISETDSVVFFYESWDAAKRSSDAKVSPQLFKRLETLSDESISYTVDSKLENGHAVQFTFYPFDESGNLSF